MLISNPRNMLTSQARAPAVPHLLLHLHGVEDALDGGVGAEDGGRTVGGAVLGERRLQLSETARPAH